MCVSPYGHLSWKYLLNYQQFSSIYLTIEIILQILQKDAKQHKCFFFFLSDTVNLKLLNSGRCFCLCMFASLSVKVPRTIFSVCIQNTYRSKHVRVFLNTKLIYCWCFRMKRVGWNWVKIRIYVVTAVTLIYSVFMFCL